MGFPQCLGTVDWVTVRGSGP